MSDLIDRQAAIDAVKEKVFHNLTDEFYGTMQVLEELPSAQPERKKGRWLRKENEWNLWYECSICGEKAPRDSIGRPWDRSDYCPNCGSYNGGGDNE